MTLPRWASVAALYALQNSMMLTPCWPRAGPTGGAGLALPALICSVTIAASFFFFGGISLYFFLGSTDPGWSGTQMSGSELCHQILATWVNDSSTGVSRPKMETRTLSFCASALTSLMVAGNVANGPSLTVTDSPTEKSTSVRVGAVPPAVVATADLRGAAGVRILTTSSTDSADGRCA